jgi:AcrR family transcriptional regulator
MTDEDDRPATTSRNSASTIARILAGAEAEFGTKGLDGAKVEDIAHAAGISKQLIYHYFNGKDDLYSEMLATIAQRNYEKLLVPDYDGLPPLQALRSFFEALFDAYQSDPFSATVTVDQGLHAGAQIRYSRRVERLREQLREQLSGVLARGHASDEIVAEIDVTMLHFLAVVVVTGCLSLRPMFLRYTRDDPQGALADDLQWRELITDFFLRAVTGKVPMGGSSSDPPPR